MTDYRDKEVIVLPMKLRESRWFDFWSNLEIGQEVKLLDRVKSTYWVHDTVLSGPPPGVPGWRITPGKLWIPLRNKNGRVYLFHIGKVRPLEEA